MVSGKTENITAWAPFSGLTAAFIKESGGTAEKTDGESFRAKTELFTKESGQTESIMVEENCRLLMARFSQVLSKVANFWADHSLLSLYL